MENLQNLLQQANIKTIVSVDDCHAFDPDMNNPDIIHAIAVHMMENLTSAAIFFRQNHCSDVVDILGDLPDETNQMNYLKNWLPSSKSIAKLYFEEFKINAQNNQLLHSLEKIRALCDHNIEIITLSNREDAKEWFAHKNNSSEIDGNVLWLIDNDFSANGGSENDGEVLIRKFIATDKDTHNFYALTSEKVNEEDFDQFRNSILEETPKYHAFSVCLIEKRIFTEIEHDEENGIKSLYERIATGFRYNYSGAILKNLDEIYDGSVKSVKEFMHSLGNDTIHRIFFLSGKEEGVVPIDIFQRFFLAMINDKISAEIAKRYDKISQHIYHYIRLCSLATIAKKDEDDYSKILSVRIAECYDNYINDRYMPVLSGDIFKIQNKSENEYYFLIGQACNLTVRTTAKRVTKCATLVQITQEDAKSKENEVSPLLPLDYFYKYTENPTKKLQWVIDFNNTINVDFNVLDLCSLHKSGEAKLPDGFDIEAQKYLYPDSIYKRLENAIADNRKAINSYRQCEDAYIAAHKDKNAGNDEKKIGFFELINQVRQDIFKDNSLLVVPDFSEGISYNLQRVTRVSETIVDNILRKYSEYHSRKAMNYDFTRNYQEIRYSVHSALDIMTPIEMHISKVMPIFTFFQNENVKKDNELKKQAEEDFLVKINSHDIKDKLSWLPEVRKSDFNLKVTDKTIKLKFSFSNMPIYINGEYSGKEASLKEEKKSFKESDKKGKSEEEKKNYLVCTVPHGCLEKIYVKNDSKEGLFCSSENGDVYVEFQSKNVKFYFPESVKICQFNNKDVFTKKIEFSLDGTKFKERLILYLMLE